MTKAIASFTIWPIELSEINAYAKISGLTTSCTIATLVRQGLASLEKTPTSKFRLLGITLAAEGAARQSVLDDEGASEHILD